MFHPEKRVYPTVPAVADHSQNVSSFASPHNREGENVHSRKRLGWGGRLVVGPVVFLDVRVLVGFFSLSVATSRGGGGVLKSRIVEMCNMAPFLPFHYVHGRFVTVLFPCIRKSFPKTNCRKDPRLSVKSVTESTRVRNFHSVYRRGGRATSR